jgi:TPR repeat protein
MEVATSLHSPVVTSSNFAAAPGRAARYTSLPETIEAMRDDANKSGDPAKQLKFAKHLLEVDGMIKENAVSVLGVADPERATFISGRLQGEAVKFLKRLASTGPAQSKHSGTEAMFLLADFHGRGLHGLPVDHNKAFSLYQAASKQNHAAATYRTAVCYEVGAGTKKDNQRAFQFYRKAASLGDPLAMHKIALIFLYGKLGQKKNLKEGISWLKRATAFASLEHPESLYDLAQCYERVGGCPVVIPDEAFAFELYNKAAQYGHAQSQFRLGSAYEFGLFGCPIDASLSIRWYSKAAEQGLADAELALSSWYLSGAEGVLRQSDADAFLWARKAAERGHAKAEFALGHYYEVGIGVERNVAEAKLWLQRSADKNYKRAQSRLQEIKKNERNALQQQEKCAIF